MSVYQSNLLLAANLISYIFQNYFQQWTKIGDTNTSGKLFRHNIHIDKTWACIILASASCSSWWANLLNSLLMGYRNQFLPLPGRISSCLKGFFHSRHSDITGVTKNFNNGFIPFKCPSKPWQCYNNFIVNICTFLTLTCQNVLCKKTGRL